VEKPIRFTAHARERLSRGATPEAASNDKIWLAVDGPEKIVAWAGQKDPSIEWENRFAHQCDIRRFMYQSPQIKRVIREHYQEVVGDVLLWS
jgi:hypothetical protein